MTIFLHPWTTAPPSMVKNPKLDLDQVQGAMESSRAINSDNWPVTNTTHHSPTISGISLTAVGSSWCFMNDAGVWRFTTRCWRWRRSVGSYERGNGRPCGISVPTVPVARYRGDACTLIMEGCWQVARFRPVMNA